MSVQRTRGFGLNVSRLVELDMAFLGPRAIVGEFAAGVAGCLAFGVLSISYAWRTHSPLWSWPVLLGCELAAAGINYLPLLGEAWRRRSDAIGLAATRAAIRNDAAEARSYGLRQAWILVPGAVWLFAITGRGETVVSSLPRAQRIGIDRAGGDGHTGGTFGQGAEDSS